MHLLDANVKVGFENGADRVSTAKDRWGKEGSDWFQMTGKVLFQFADGESFDQCRHRERRGSSSLASSSLPPERVFENTGGVPGWKREDQCALNYTYVIEGRRFRIVLCVFVFVC